MSDKETSRYYGKIGYLVNGRVETLQNAVVVSGAPWGRAVLANLRKATQREPGSMQEIWDWTQCPADEYFSDEPTKEEWAVHGAMCLYAVHQQGQGQKINRSGQGLGGAVRQLAGDDTRPDSPLRRRFARVMTAASINEALYHLRGLISQFRSAQPPIGVDYGMLADDLYSLQFPDGPAKVRLRWSRQYYRTPEVGPKNTKEESK